MNFHQIRWIALVLGIACTWYLYWHWYQMLWQDRIVVGPAGAFLVYRSMTEIIRKDKS